MTEYEQQELLFPKQEELPLPSTINTLLEQYSQAETQYKALESARKGSSPQEPPITYSTTQSQAGLITGFINKPLYLSSEEATSLEGQVELITNRRGKPAAQATDLAQRIESIGHQDASLARKQVVRINKVFHQYLEAGTFNQVEEKYQEQANTLVVEAPKYLGSATSEEKDKLRRAISEIPQKILSKEAREQYAIVQEQLYEEPNPAVAKENIRKLKGMLEDE